MPRWPWAKQLLSVCCTEVSSLWLKEKTALSNAQARVWKKLLSSSLTSLRALSNQEFLKSQPERYSGDAYLGPRRPDGSLVVIHQALVVSVAEQMR
ncbi:hypothetical protein CEXT_692881 [Caerostris extrusa]|uniref:Uncharacterized protein n=1 Tax=Caerostris extrusa TaxID=172846 RepID=A0AAV4P5K6_CAEEX|nr:hypothetical protein CEXT_692881 [Caerostris extrusa]